MGPSRCTKHSIHLSHAGADASKAYARSTVGEGRMEMVLHPRYMKSIGIRGCQRSTKSDWLSFLPEPILEQIFSHVLTARDLCSLALVSKTARMWADNPKFWRQACLVTFKVDPKAQPTSWKELYKFNQEILREVLLNKNLQRILDEAYPRLWKFPTTA